MKKLTMVIIAAAFVSLVGCAKDWTCTCTETTSSTSGTPPVTTAGASSTVTTQVYKKVKKKDVRDQCASTTDVTTTKIGTNTAVTNTTNNCELTK